eukprot:Gregarina_sp_Poly_1__824@NODE_1198_length_4803_cov_95_037162_g823_i0_p1_GENE_NODE_1198_length_4803_cov_95_037162_g823_i0NODE_1198_length_4803_cov_95_037162_g823_i0_p1_ORF_typecomplete_len333_score27_23PrmA/PF06325_13/6e15MTS/PF05175_14/5_4e11PRMT5/PF05185_16/1_3e09Methyltransf_25/PF13649_6/1_1e08Met_10/PF02475_16/1_1e08Methyltransf_31/PF13847_6/2_2e08Methyltransf_18/PF12847_7/7_8e08Cons_hypoth95/PF03602_15/1_4e07CMAS/PF02353_20/5_5e07DOT1/PF08123_13/9_1e07RrnaAD/PF00398_20/9_3e07PCMT/PF01135_19/
MSNQTANDPYFESYGRYEVHKKMLMDSVRVNSYFKAITDNAQAFKNKIVLDVGSGTGILSMLVAKHTRAKAVYAIEGNFEVADISRQLLKDNQLDDRVFIMSGSVEELAKSNDIPMVDIIISEWMGHYLVHESMLDSVLVARDRWLQKSPQGTFYSSVKIVPGWSSETHGGLMFPLQATISGTFFDASQVLYEREDWMRDLNRFHGLNLWSLSGMADLENDIILEHLSEMPHLAEITDVAKLNLAQLNPCNLNRIASEHLLMFTAVTPSGWANGFVLWWTCVFPTFGREAVVLSTAPGQDPTHWKQVNLNANADFSFRRPLSLFQTKAFPPT